MDFHSNPISISLALILALLFALILFRESQQKRRKNKRFHPIGGTIFNQLLNFHRLQHYMTDLAGKDKTYKLLSRFRSEIYTTDPANVEYMLKTIQSLHDMPTRNIENLSMNRKKSM
jgi:hypothetical protein